MAKKQKSFFLVAVIMLCHLFIGSAGIGYLLTEIEAGNYNLSEKQIAAANVEPQKPRTFTWKEQYAICALHDLECSAKRIEVDESVEAQIQEFSLGELIEVYPLPEWHVQEDDNEIIITHNLEGLCKAHHGMYHLGSSENGQYVAVYYGPSAVGSDAGAFLVTDVPLQRLSTEQLAELTEGKYEYRSQDDLIAMLDNFSEF